MQRLPLLPLLLLLLGAGSAVRQENHAPRVQSPEMEPEWGWGLDGTKEQAGESVLAQEVTPTVGDEAKTSWCQDALENGEATEEAPESDAAALDKDSLCPRQEDTVPIQGAPGYQTYRYLLVRTPKAFNQAQDICRRCYHGNLVSIHSFRDNARILLWVSKINQPQVWIGGFLKGWFLWKKFRWTDGSSWDFGYWARGQPGFGRGCCVALCTKGGHWRRTRCYQHLPFVCSY